MKLLQKPRSNLCTVFHIFLLTLSRIKLKWVKHPDVTSFKIEDSDVRKDKRRGKIMSKNFKEEDEKEQRERNVFRCTLISINGMLANMLNGIERVFMHKALTHDSPTLYIS